MTFKEREKSIVLIRTAEGFEAGGVTSTHSALRYANAITVHCVLRKAHRPKSRHLIRMLMSLDPFPGAHHPESRIQNAESLWPKLHYFLVTLTCRCTFGYSIHLSLHCTCLSFTLINIIPAMKYSLLFLVLTFIFMYSYILIKINHYH